MSDSASSGNAPSSSPSDNYAERFRRSTPTLAEPAFTLTSLGGSGLVVRASGVACGIKKSGRPDVGLLAFDAAVPAAGVFTQNKLAAAPVVVSREHLKRSGGVIRAILATSGNANACTGERGLADTREMAARVAERLDCPAEQVLVACTGVIGVHLPMDNVRSGIDAAVTALSADAGAGRRFARAIMTTDAFPKEASATQTFGETQATVAGVAKGAGMIEPNMATMLAFVGTDASIPAGTLADLLPRLAGPTFNSVHVDSHPSTNDTLIAFATGRVELPTADDGATAMPESAMTEVCRQLAWLIARDGEGATKVTTVTVTGASSNAAADEIARYVVTSTLVRTALFGNDPNWGRIASQVGNCPAVVDISPLKVTLAGHTVYADGGPTAFDRPAASAAMRDSDDLELTISLADGNGSAAVMTSDLGYKYVEINAEYTT